MAFFDDEDDDKQTLKTGASSASSIGGAGGDIGSGAASKETSAKGSGWTNLKSYLDANSSEPERMGEQINDDQDTNYQKADTSISKWETDVGKNVASGVQQGDQPDLDNPDGITAEQMNAWLNPTYTGPATPVSTPKLNKDMGKLDQIGKDSGDFHGRFNLLNDSYGRDNYSSGEQGFDSFLLGQPGSKMKDLQDKTEATHEKAKTVTGGLQSLIDEAPGKASDSAYDTLRDKVSIYDNSADSYGRLDNTIMNEADKKEIEQRRRADLLRKYLNP